MSATANSKIRAVVFDLGDTLIHGNFTAGDSSLVWEMIYQEVINPACDPAIPDLELVRASLNEKVHKSMALVWKDKTEEEQDLIELFRSAFNHAGLDCGSDNEFIGSVIAMEQRLLYQRVVEVGPTTYDTLGELRKRGYKLGLCSNFCNITEVVYENLARLGLVELFDQTILSCELGWRKPSVLIYQAICEKLQVAPEECLFVGDRLIEDVRGPQSLGMKAVLSHEFRQEEMMDGLKPDAIISRLDELLGVLDSLN